MGIIPKLLVALTGNAFGLYLAGRYISGVTVPSALSQLLIAAAILTAINLLVKPILKLVLSPILFLTFGLGIILVNALTLYLLEYINVGVTITQPISLLYATLLISVVNAIIRHI